MMSQETSKNWTRRSILGATAGTLAIAGFNGRMVSHALALSATTNDIECIDAHVHVWPSFGTSYPLAKEFSAKDVEPASFTPEQLLETCTPHQVKRVVLIQMNFFGFDNSYMLDAIAKYPKVFSGVAVIDHDAPALRETMKTMHERGVRGYRLYATQENVAKWQSSEAIHKMFAAGTELGQAMCMLSDPEALEGIDRLCAKHPDTRVVIDHFSRIGMRSAVKEQELEALCRLARHPNVFVKTSAFYALGAKKPPYLDLIPMIERLVKAFGAQRLMWASDCPYQVQPPHTYAASIALVRDHVPFASAADRQAVLSGTAERVFFQ